MLDPCVRNTTNNSRLAAAVNVASQTIFLAALVTAVAIGTIARSAADGCARLARIKR